MIEALKTKIRESDHPVGTKRPNHIKLPPEDHVYGLETKKDKEGVSIITRSWKVHDSSKTAQPPQDFITINKLAIKMNATNFNTNKDFRKNIDIRQKVRVGQKLKKVELPPEDFTYGLPNAPGTPVKEVINNAYGNRAEEIIRQEYDAFIKEKTKIYRRPPKVVPRYISKKVEEMKKRDEEKKMNDLDVPYEVLEEEMRKKKEEKPLYKMKMFQNVGSKVAEGIKQFKTYKPVTKAQKLDAGVDDMIQKLQNEAEQKDNIEQPVINNDVNCQEPVQA